MRGRGKGSQCKWGLAWPPAPTAPVPDQPCLATSDPFPGVPAGPLPKRPCPARRSSDHVTRQALSRNLCDPILDCLAGACLQSLPGSRPEHRRDHRKAAWLWRKRFAAGSDAFMQDRVEPRPKPRHSTVDNGDIGEKRAALRPPTEHCRKMKWELALLPAPTAQSPETSPCGGYLGPLRLQSLRRSVSTCLASIIWCLPIHAHPRSTIFIGAVPLFPGWLP